MKKRLFYPLLGVGCLFCCGIAFAQKTPIILAENDGFWEGTKEVASDVWKGTKEVSSDVWDGTKNVAGDIKDGVTGRDEHNTTDDHSKDSNSN